MGRRFIRQIEDEQRTLRGHHHHPSCELICDHVIVAHMIASFNPARKNLRHMEGLFV